MKEISQTNIQSTILDFALIELVRQQRTTFQPLWTLDSWAKFLIWLALNIGLSGDRDSLQSFADAMGQPLTSRMRRIFFERKLENLSLHIMADPAEEQVLLLPLGCSSFNDQTDFLKALKYLELDQKVVLDQRLWKAHDSLISIPWNHSESDT